jgi:alanyl-tRNA synthetase
MVDVATGAAGDGARDESGGIPAYEREPYRREMAVRVLRTGADEGRSWAILDDTLCYPEGGGQPADHGRLGEVAVLDVQKVEGERFHYLAAACEPGEAVLVLDWQRRYDHMQQHTAQHLLSAVALERLGWATRSFHLGEDRCDIELDVAAPGASDLTALEAAVAAEIRAARPVRTRRISPEEYAALDVRSRGLPADHQGDIRLVEIEGVDLNTCGGTHVASTAEIEAVALLGSEPLRGGCRLHWVAGSRVRRRLAGHEARNSQLRSLLDTGEAELVAIVAQRLEQLDELRRGLRQASGRLAELEAEGLAQRALETGAPVDQHFPQADAAFVQQVAKRFAERCPRGLALVTGGGPEGGVFAVAAGSDSGLDLQALGRRVAEALDGRGGGRAPVFQGKVGSLAGRDAALETMRRATESGREDVPDGTG